MRLAEIPKRAAQRAENETHQTCQPVTGGIQPDRFSAAADAGGDAEHVGGRDPLAAVHGGIADGENAVCSFFVNCISMQDKSSVGLIEYNASTAQAARRSRPDGHDVAVADGGIHAGPAGAERDGRALAEQRGDDFRVFGHDDRGFRMEKVVQAMNNTSIVFRARRAAVLALAGGLWCCAAQAAALNAGEAVVAAMTGQAQARTLTAPVHEGKSDLQDLFEGAAVGENVRVITGKDGRLCLVCSPGAILCVAPDTEIAIDQLRHTADGLPKTDDDLIRRIHVRMIRGRLRAHAGAPTPTLDLRIETPDGAVEAHGGSFAVAQDGQGAWHVANEADELSVAPRSGKRTALRAGEAIRFAADGVETEPATANAALYQFELCNAYFADLEPFIERDRPFDRAGLSDYLGLATAPVALDAGALVTDASPAIRPAVAATLPARAPRAQPGEPGGRWDAPRIWSWYRDIGVVKGVNYVPRTAVNSVETWMADTFDPDTIDQELGWAHGVGYTVVRVQLQFAVWQADPDGFLRRVNRLLELAAKHDLRVVPVLFDDLNLAGAAPQIGEQPAPLPGEYNARWVPSPAPETVKDSAAWPALEKYLRAVMDEFKRDDRVLYWDLYNTAGNGGLGEGTLPLLDQVFNWARDVDPAQPLAVPAWREFGSAMAARKLERSDLVTFHSFDSAEGIEARIQMLRRYERPIICSDWLMRQTGNDFEKVLPVFATYQVGWFNRGLVAGKTQMQIQEKQYRSEEQPGLWQQNVLKEDGTPYSEREVQLIQSFRFMENP